MVDEMGYMEIYFTYNNRPEFQVHQGYAQEPAVCDVYFSDTSLESSHSHCTGPLSCSGNLIEIIEICCIPINTLRRWSSIPYPFLFQKQNKQNNTYSSGYMYVYLYSLKKEIS